MRFTAITLGLSILANLVTPPLRGALGMPTQWRLLDHWYIFVVVILVVFLVETLRILFDKDKSDLWRGKLYGVLSAVHRTKENEKAYVINDLNGRINLARRDLEYTSSLLPKLVQVEWVDRDLHGAETYDLKEGEYIVRVSNKDSQQKNIIDIVHACTRRTSLRGLRHILDKNRPFQNSVDEVISENIILKINNRHIVDCYYRDYLQPCLQADDAMRRYFETAKNVDDLGMFFRVFLAELEYFSNRITGKPFKSYLLGEIEHLLDFLNEITPEKTPSGEVQLSYERAFLRTAVLLIRSEKIVNVGLDNYLKMVQHYLDHAFNSFYIIYFERRSLSYWKQFDRLVNDLIREIRRHVTIEKDYDEHYEVTDDRGVKKQARCVRFAIEQPIS